MFFHSMGHEVIEDFDSTGLANWTIKPTAGSAPKRRLVAQEVRWIDAIKRNPLQ